jgi:hypothetical protein
VEGFLDERNQAFLTLDFGQGPLVFEIDTGFTGTLLVGEELFDPAKAMPAGYVDAEFYSLIKSLTVWFDGIIGSTCSW